MRKIGRNIEAKKDAIRVVYMAMDQKTQEVVEMVDSCCDGYELFRIAKRLGKRKMLQELVILEMKVGQWKWGWLKGAYQKAEECWEWME